MTRLIAEDVKAIPAGLPAYDAALKTITGCSLGELAARAAGPGADRLKPESCSVAVTPLTAGLGPIEGFAEAVVAIAFHLGFQGFITRESDLQGLIEAYRSGVDAVVMADDNVYAAINIKTGRIADNDEATAKGYGTALALMAGNLSGREVLLIGAGRIGSKAAVFLCEAGARVIIYDTKSAAAATLVGELKTLFGNSAAQVRNLEEALAAADLIFDASPGRGIIGAEQVGDKTIAVAPGLPLGFDDGAVAKLKNNLLHDPLQIGTAVMLYAACLQPVKDKSTRRL